MKKILWAALPFIVGVTAIPACNQQGRHFLTNPAYRDSVHQQFERRRTEAAGRSEALFAVFNQEGLSAAQREALEFLYAYMPLCDLADYDGSFFLRQVNGAFRAREYFSWGKTIPEDIFRHFVLVYRTNNEHLDTARDVFFEELKDCLKGLSMYEAALEVNHWCHEKVTYRGTDSRTSAPLALARTSWGRCGEESTFATTAMRAVGIPARQCYTPRWAHTDDNHAWVEVWIDGKWHYLGACEPEPELDAAWFTAPAKRAMMVHTNVFGAYTGPEQKNLETPLYSKINLLANYAATRSVNVQVTDPSGAPVEQASVQFQVYNYAEMYPIAETKTDASGRTSIISGNGDLLIWAGKGSQYGYAKSSPQDTLTIVRLDRTQGAAYEESLVMNVPPEVGVPALPPDKVAANALRLAREDSIRNSYMATFVSQEQAYVFAEKNNLNKDEAWKHLHRAQGNWQAIQALMAARRATPDLFPFLASLSDKDLRDTPEEYLAAYLPDRSAIAIQEGVPADMVVQYVLSPRIEAELIKPRRPFFQEKTSPAADPVSIIQKYISGIILNDDGNYYNCRISPQGVRELGIADRRSRNVAFVAECRSNGIVARIERATGKPQYWAGGRWQDVAFDAESAQVSAPAASITLASHPANVVKPAYSANYSLARFQDGTFRTLDFWGNSAVAKMPYTLKLEKGYYRLLAGSRANDGSVFVNAKYFELKDNVPYAAVVQLPKTEGKLLVKGIVDPNTIAELMDGGKATLKELAGGKGLVVCFLDPGKEPSKHILQDFPAAAADLDAWGGGVAFVIPSDKQSAAFDRTAFKGLPASAKWLADPNRALLTAATGALGIDFKENFPLTIYLSNNGGILFAAEGYRIGTGAEVLGVIAAEAAASKGCRVQSAPQ